jgi:hypothetical protein
MKHILSGKMASSEEIRMFFPVAFWMSITSGLDLVKSHKHTTIHTVQIDVDLAKIHIAHEVIIGFTNYS